MKINSISFCSTPRVINTTITRTNGNVIVNKYENHNSNDAYVISFGKLDTITRKENYKKIIDNGYSFHSSVKIKDSKGKVVLAHIFMKKTPNPNPGIDYREYIMTNNNYEDIGMIRGYTSQKEGMAYISYLNNYANVHNEHRCDIDSPISGKWRPEQYNTRYKDVGRKLYETWEKMVLEEHPEINFIETQPARCGSKAFFAQRGFEHRRTENILKRVPDMCEDEYFHYEYYRKFLRDCPEAHEAFKNTYDA